jgi:F420-0:gamma-glutamyl ligase
MESKNIHRVTFAELADARLVMTLVSSHADMLVRSAAHMKSIGIADNSPAMAEARKDCRSVAELIIACIDEFSRLHVECDCTVTDEQIRETRRGFVEMIAGIDAETAAAGPINRDPVRAVEELNRALKSFTGAEYETSSGLAETLSNLDLTVKNVDLPADGNGVTGFYL